MESSVGHRTLGPGERCAHVLPRIDSFRPGCRRIDQGTSSGLSLIRFDRAARPEIVSLCLRLGVRDRDEFDSGDPASRCVPRCGQFAFAGSRWSGKNHDALDISRQSSAQDRQASAQDFSCASSPNASQDFAQRSQILAHASQTVLCSADPRIMKFELV